jgi:hypothetical protein
MIWSVCQFPWCKFFQHRWFQAPSTESDIGKRCAQSACKGSWQRWLHFGWERHFKSRQLKMHGKQWVSQRDNEPLAKITRCSYIIWVVGSKARTSWANLQGQNELTRPSWSVQFDNKSDGQVVRFNENLTRCQPITNKFKGRIIGPKPINAPCHLLDFSFHQVPPVKELCYSFNKLCVCFTLNSPCGVNLL